MQGMQATNGADEDVRVAFGRRVRELRHIRGLSQEQLAERCGLHRTYIGGIERGERNPALLNINAIALALKISLQDLFSYTDTHPAEPGAEEPRPLPPPLPDLGT